MNDIIGKIKREITSVKFLSIVSTFVLFLSDKISQETFATILCSIIGIRELSDIVNIIKKK